MVNCETMTHCTSENAILLLNFIKMFGDLRKTVGSLFQFQNGGSQYGEPGKDFPLLIVIIFQRFFVLKRNDAARWRAIRSRTLGYFHSEGG